MFERLWAENRRFVLVAGTGFAVFLILNSCVSSCGSRLVGPQGLYARAERLEKDIRRLHKSLGQYSVVQTYLEGYEREETSLREALEIAPEPEIRNFDAAAPALQFERAVDRIWGQALSKANRANVAIPDKPSLSDFRIGRGDGPAEYDEHYRKLALLRRALDALIDSEASQISRPAVLDPEEFAIAPGDGSVTCVFYGVEFRAEGSLASFFKLLSALQAPPEFLQVRLVSLAPKRGESGDPLEGTIQFWSFRFLEGKETGGGSKTKGAKRW